MTFIDFHYQNMLSLVRLKLFTLLTHIPSLLSFVFVAATWSLDGLLLKAQLNHIAQRNCSHADGTADDAGHEAYTGMIAEVHHSRGVNSHSLLGYDEISRASCEQEVSANGRDEADNRPGVALGVVI